MLNCDIYFSKVNLYAKIIYYPIRCTGIYVTLGREIILSYENI